MPKGNKKNLRRKKIASRDEPFVRWQTRIDGWYVKKQNKMQNTSRVNFLSLFHFASGTGWLVEREHFSFVKKKKGTHFETSWYIYLQGTCYLCYVARYIELHWFKSWLIITTTFACSAVTHCHSFCIQVSKKSFRVMTGVWTYFVWHDDDLMNSELCRLKVNGI